MFLSSNTNDTFVIVTVTKKISTGDDTCWQNYLGLQERPAVADKPARRLRNVCTVYVRVVGL